MFERALWITAVKAVSATLSLAALGQGASYINGVRVRIPTGPYRVYDVTDMLLPGRNAAQLTECGIIGAGVSCSSDTPAKAVLFPMDTMAKKKHIRREAASFPEDRRGGKTAVLGMKRRK